MFFMRSERREFTPEYKDEAVKLVINTGQAVATVARELSVKEQTLGRWVNAYRARHQAGERISEWVGAGRAGPAAQGDAELRMDRVFL
jgi:transposase